ncbi:hypothetical protein LCGC14_0368020 [marine sediment metagenome]|uniref:FMN-binding domain-containing protein n=1 Tax=marine sediment metagenome TaxID=412755 RepID=A0A0F9VT99_9ZZZZ
MKDNLYAIAYSAVLGLVCALALTAVGELTAERIAANKKAEEMRNILGVLGISFEAKAPFEDLEAVFDKNVRLDKVGEVKMYRYLAADGETVQATAVPFAGPGLWGPIRGFLSLEADMVTIRGVTFHEQEETPGLGGEIAAICPGNHDEAMALDCPAWFRHQFKGKRIVDADNKPAIWIVRGGASGPNEVDAMTGATMTGDKVQAMLKEIIVKIVAATGASDGR